VGRSAMNPDAAAIRDLSFRYRRDDRDALAIEALRIEAGQCVALIGASGAGKSTLLRLLDGRLRGWSGEVTVLGHALDPAAPPPRRWRSQTGFIFQEFALVEQASVRQNVLNGRLGRTDPLWSLLGRFSDEDEDAACRAMRDVGLEEFAERRVDRLSGGQHPGLILADEPVSNLDPVTAETVLGLLRDCAARRGTALVISSHQPHLAARFVARFVALDHGRIIFDGAPDALRDEQLSGIYDAPARTLAEASP
jgi:phosphonate transport system ATP-binding protein